MYDLSWGLAGEHRFLNRPYVAPPTNDKNTGTRLSTAMSFAMRKRSIRSRYAGMDRLGLWLEHSDVTDVSSHDSETPTLVASVK